MDGVASDQPDGLDRDGQEIFGHHAMPQPRSVPVAVHVQGDPRGPGLGRIANAREGPDVVIADDVPPERRGAGFEVLSVAARVEIR